MKNILYGEPIKNNYLLKNTLRVMKIQFVLLFVCCLGMYANNAYSQKVTIRTDNSKVMDILREIEEKTDYLFVYNKDEVDLNRKASINVNNQEITEILSKLFGNSDVKYVVEGNNVILMKNETLQQTQKKISGTVVDNYGDPIIGANVMEKGTTNGTITNIDGNFSLTVDANAVISVTFIGYVAEELSVRDRNSFNIQLKEDAKVLEEVVVVGYGTMRKKDLTGSVVQIRPDRIANENPKTVQDILRGTPGLQVGFNSSAKGGGDMEIRGRRSVYDEGGHNNPLLILDGMPFYGELSEINPNDIGQIDVLKDASAAAIYGSKAANGVIILTTKQGKQGKPVVNVTTNIGFTEVNKVRERFNTADYLRHRQDWYEKNTYGVNPETGRYEAYQRSYANQPGYFVRPDQLPPNVSLDTWRAYTTDNGDASDLSIWAQRMGFKGNALENFLAGKTVDWSKQGYRTGFNQDYNASISGAGEKVNYYLSLGYMKNQGADRNDEYQAVRANMKINAKVTDWFEVGANVNFQDRSDGNIELKVDDLLRNSPFADHVDADGNPVQYPLDKNYSQRGYNYDFEKQFLDLEKGYTILNSIFNAKVKLPYGITYSFNASPRYQFFYERYFMSRELPGSDPKKRGVNREQTRHFDWSLNNTITWDYMFKDKHHVIVTLVQEAEDISSWKDRIEARNILPTDNLGLHDTKNGSKSDSKYESEDKHQTADALLARLFYSYDDRYMFTGSIRRDGYSAFGSSNPYATFPSVALAWSFTNEKFFQWNNIMSTGKLRASYGKNGNRSLKDPYVALSNLGVGAGNMHGYLNSSGQLELLRYLMVDRMANPKLQWEKTEAWNFALDFGFLNDRITGSIEYYTMRTHDMIMNQRLPEFMGFPQITTNLGQVNNNGFELSLNTLNINNRNLQWTTTFHFAYNRNKIVHLEYEYEDVVDANGKVIGRKEKDDKTNNWFIGKSIGEIWDYKVTGIWQADEVEEAARHGQVPGDPKVANSYTADDKVNADGSVTPVYNDNDKQFLGRTIAPINWSMRNEFVLWGNLSLSFNIYSKMGHKSAENFYLNPDDNGGRMAYALQNVEKKKYWTPDNPTNKYARIEAVGPTGAGSPKKIYNRSFVRLENISVGYTLPQHWTKKLDIERVKVFGSIRNVAVWGSNWEYGDPEADPRTDKGNGLSTRTYSLGLNLTF